MYLFPSDTEKKVKNQDRKIPPSAQVAEEADRTTAVELDEFFRKGKETIIKSEDNKNQSPHSE